MDTRVETEYTSIVQEKKPDLKGLLYPKTVAFIGGDDAEIAAKQCLQFGFKGHVWAVNPKRKQLAGINCLSNIHELPEGPDLVFLGVSRESTIEIVKSLANINTKAVICFAAGFAELGSEGERKQQQLIQAAGEMLVLGPNCYGLINANKSLAVWPYFHGCRAVNQGIALISQSGMLATSLSMNRRSVEFSHIISLGNQAMLGAEDFIEVLNDDDSVSAFALYLESIRDIEKFKAVTNLAISKGKPVVILEMGDSDLNQKISAQHTGRSENYLCLVQEELKENGIIMADSTNQLLESLKVLTHSILPKGLKTAVFTCSGGDAALFCKTAQKYGLTFPQPSNGVEKKLLQLLPKIATVNNPLDCTTQLWGKPEIEKIFHTMMEDDYDLAVFVQDYPKPQIDFNYETDLNEAKYFYEAVSKKKIPAIICSSISENLNAKVRDYLSLINVIASQGFGECCQAILHSYKYNNILNKV